MVERYLGGGCIGFTAEPCGEVLGLSARKMTKGGLDGEMYVRSMYSVCVGTLDS